MAKKLFVRNLSYDLTVDQLREAFEAIGKVISATIVMDRYTGKSRGFGFVEMESSEDANKAIEKLNGHELGGRELAVDKARDNDRPREGANRSRDRERG